MSGPQIMDRITYNKKIQSVLHVAGYTNISHISDTLQGSVWRVTKKNGSKSSIIKVTNKYLHKNGIGMMNNQIYRVHENIIKEANILKLLSSQRNAPKSIVKFKNLFSSKDDYFLVMEDGGPTALFEFIQKVHRLINIGHIDISEWHKVAKIIFTQMVECIDYIHSLNICHMDISLENFLINDVKVICDETNLNESGKPQMKFVTDNIVIKLCDFGTAELFTKESQFLSKKYCGKTSYKSPECTARKGYFNAISNDIWCLGICLFMMTIGSPPFNSADKSDRYFIQIISGNLLFVLESWNKLKHVNANLMLLLQSFLKYERTRITVSKIKQHAWLK